MLYDYFLIGGDLLAYHRTNGATYEVEEVFIEKGTLLLRDPESGSVLEELEENLIITVKERF